MIKVYAITKFKWYKGQLIVAAEHSRIRFGEFALCKGASGEQKDLQQQQADFSKQLMGMYQQQFGNQQAVFNAIKSVYDPILKAGASQYGFSSAEDAALRTQASEGTAQSYQQASSAAAERAAASGGGNTLLPSGVQAQVQGQLAGAAAESESGKQLDITRAGYDVGRQQFNQATNVEMGVAAGYNPLGYAGAAQSSSSAAFNEATKIQEMNQAASPWGTIGGLIGGAAGSFLGPMGASIGKNIGGMIGNAGSGNAFPTPDYSTISFGSDTGSTDGV